MSLREDKPLQGIALAVLVFRKASRDIVRFLDSIANFGQRPEQKRSLVDAKEIDPSPENH